MIRVERLWGRRALATAEAPEIRADTGFVGGYEEFLGFRCKFYVVAGTCHRLDGDLLAVERRVRAVKNRIRAVAVAQRREQHIRKLGADQQTHVLLAAEAREFLGESLAPTTTLIRRGAYGSTIAHAGAVRSILDKPS